MISTGGQIALTWASAAGHGDSACPAASAGTATKRSMEMSQDNTITVRGYVTAEPKMWQRTPEQSPVATIRVGSTPRKLNRETGEWQDGETSYYSVKCWRKL